MTETKRVYTLYRVSTLGQVEKDDIPMQKEYCRDFIAEHHDWRLVKEVFEKGVSGFKKSAKERDAILDIQQAAIKGEFDVLLVYMFDRLGRRDDETPFIVEWFVNNGIEVWSAKEGQRRFETHVDKLLNYITFWQASGESIKTSIRVKTRMEQLTAEGVYTGGTVPYGYRLVHNGRMNKRNRAVFDIAIDEDAAETIRLIFRLYVQEGYGTQRLSRYLAEHNITKPNGKNFPNTSLNHIIKDKLYVGIIHNGDVESDVIPELQIVDRDIFDEAQRLMTARATHHGDTPLNMSGRSLLIGNVFCGCCRNRLTMSTSGHKHTRKDGTVIRKTRFMYQCHYGVRHPGECDGQTVYNVEKLDSIVEEIMLYQFSKIQMSNGKQIVSEAHKTHIARAKSAIGKVKRELVEKQKELTDYQAEILRVIRGDSAFTQEMLTPLLTQAQADVDRLTAALEAAQTDLRECELSADDEMKEYKQIQTWADLYKTCTFEAKKMIVSRFIKSIYVHRGYDLEIEFNVPFEEFRHLTIIADETTPNSRESTVSVSA